MISALHNVRTYTSRREQDAHSKVLTTSPHNRIARVQLQQNKQATQNPTTLSATAAHPTASPLPRRTTHSPLPAPHRHLTQRLCPAATRLPTPSLGMQSSYPSLAFPTNRPARRPGSPDPRRSRAHMTSNKTYLTARATCPNRRDKPPPSHARPPVAAEASPNGAVLCISRPSERASDVQAGKRTTGTWRSRGGS
jgi:hypothetical protein